MAVIHAFRGLRYDPRAVGDVGRVLAPPYDAISPGTEQRLFDASPHNVVRVELGDRGAEDRYAAAAATLGAWRREGVLVREERPSLYVTSIQVDTPEGPRERIGVTVRARLVGLDDATLPAGERILRHERTLSGPKEDRLRMLRATATHTSSVFVLVDDPAGDVERWLSPVLACDPDVRARDIASVEHRLWVVSDPQAVAALTALLAPRPFLIADGHHRYETALRYRDERRAGAAQGLDDVMLYVCRMQDPGLQLLGYHRSVRAIQGFDAAHVLDRLRETFDVSEHGALDGGAPAPSLLHSLAERPGGRTAIAAAVGDRQYLLAARAPSSPDALDTAVLETAVLHDVLGLTPERIRAGGVVEFHHDAGEAFAEVATGRAQMAFVLNPVDVHTVARLAARGEVMPQKSTWFSPKVPTGLVMNPVDG